MLADGLQQQRPSVCRVLLLLRHRVEVEGSTALQLLLCYAVGALQQQKHIVRLCVPAWVAADSALAGCQQACCRT